MAATTFDEAAVRARFPALAQKQVYMDNAGGSQVLGSVISSITDYFSNNNVQLGASYPIGQLSTSKFSDGYAAGAKYINATPDEVVFGPSTTQLLRNLSTALKVEPGDEIVLSKMDHEANIAGWLQMARWKGLQVKWWAPSKNATSNPRLEPDDLKALLGPKTRLVCCTHTSNILGTVTDVAALAAVIRANSPRTLFCVDAVAYAPHAGVDVKALGVDFYSFSWYKVYGPHVAMLYVKADRQKELESLGHYFKKGENLEELMGLAGGSYEAIQSIPKVVEYLDEVGWDNMAKQEETIQEILLSWLRAKRDAGVVKIYGEPSCDRKLRVPVISFGVQGWKSIDVIAEIEKRSSFGCRYGHFYSRRLCEEVLGLTDVDDGVVRVSLLHYNTADEVKGLVKLLDEILGSKSTGAVDIPIR